MSRFASLRAETFLPENFSPDFITDTGMHFILEMYGASTSLDNYRYLKTKFSSLPPVQQYCYRMYYHRVSSGVGH